MTESLLMYLQPGFVAQFAQVRDRSAPLTPDQLALLKTLPLEPGGRSHRRGVLSMAHQPNDVNSAESTFDIILGTATYLDGRYTMFGQIVAGDAVLAALERPGCGWPEKAEDSL